MAEEYTCIECENLYDNKDGDTDERMCRKCLDKIYVERLKDWNDAIKLTPEYKLGKKLLNNEISNLTTKNIIDNDKEEGTDVK